MLQGGKKIQLTLHAKSAYDVYLSFWGWNSDDLERINFVKKNEVVETTDGFNMIIHHKHILAD